MSSTNMTAILIDASNLAYHINLKFPNRRLDYQAYLDQALGADTQYLAKVYITGKVRRANKFAHCIEHYGYKTDIKVPEMRVDPATKKKIPIRTSRNMEIAVDAFRCIEKVDRFVIGTADGELSTLLKFIKEQGKQVDVFALSPSKYLKEQADNIIEITEGMLWQEKDGSVSQELSLI